MREDLRPCHRRSRSIGGTGVGLHGVFLVVPKAEAHRAIRQAAVALNVPGALALKADLRTAGDDDQDVPSLKPKTVWHPVGRDAGLERDAHNAIHRFDGLHPTPRRATSRG